MNVPMTLFFRIWVRMSAALYGGEGINIPFIVMPTRLIGPTLRAYGAQIGERVRFLAPLVVHNSGGRGPAYYRHLRVGNDCYFGRDLFLDLQERIVVENNVTISHRVMILTHTDAGTSPLRDTGVPTTQAPVMIREGAYIGAHATILQGVEIGERAVVGAGALVTKNIPAQHVVAGVPAKVIKVLAEPEQIPQETEQC